MYTVSLITNSVFTVRNVIVVRLNIRNDTRVWVRILLLLKLSVSVPEVYDTQSVFNSKIKQQFPTLKLPWIIYIQ